MAEGSIAENKEQGEVSLKMDGWNQVICSHILNSSHNHVFQIFNEPHKALTQGAPETLFVTN